MSYSYLISISTCFNIFFKYFFSRILSPKTLVHGIQLRAFGRDKGQKSSFNVHCSFIMIHTINIIQHYRLHVEPFVLKMMSCLNIHDCFVLAYFAVDFFFFNDELIIACQKVCQRLNKKF